MTDKRKSGTGGSGNGTATRTILDLGSGLAESGAGAVVPLPEFRLLSEREVRDGIDGGQKPVQREVERLMDGYVAKFQEHARRLGRPPDVVMHTSARSPIEVHALRLLTEAIRQARSELGLAQGPAAGEAGGAPAGTAFERMAGERAGHGAPSHGTEPGHEPDDGFDR